MFSLEAWSLKVLYKGLNSFFYLNYFSIALSEDQRTLGSPDPDSATFCNMGFTFVPYTAEMAAELPERNVDRLTVHLLVWPGGEVVGHALVQLHPTLLPQPGQHRHRQALAAQILFITIR